MDNFTHAVAGMVLAEAAAQYHAKDETLPKWRAAAYFTAIFTNNAADLDFLWVPLTGGRIGYLMHHRGHTHTLLAALPIALLALGLVFAWSRLRHREYGRSGWNTIAALAVLGPLMHITMDFTNNYGVHPFWPFDTRWFYGDAVFIIEPFFWAYAIPPLILCARSWITRVILALPLAGILVAAWVHPLARWPIASALCVTVVLVSVLARRAKAGLRIAVAGLGWIGVTLMFAATSVEVQDQMRRELDHAFPSARTHDLIVTPLPGDPMCWNVLAVQTDGDRYLLRTASFATDPDWTEAATCERERRDLTAPAVDLSGAPSRKVKWGREVSLPLSELQAIYREHCDAAAMLRFLRAPFWVRDADGGLILGDLRYDREKELGFAEVKLNELGAPCPQWVPDWTPPRIELLE